ncbi:unnamed protein product [Acanthosepion pharaonis]|uniref:Uncharacterized protein n=1 Tax=Acanthosepion pharaonis TaxID=158019 RepID=A0A812C886_ACAPH|nr:unnamed protein product [Sepia pharaonis]
MFPRDCQQQQLESGKTKYKYIRDDDLLYRHQKITASSSNTTISSSITSGADTSSNGDCSSHDDDDGEEEEEDVDEDEEVLVTVTTDGGGEAHCVCVFIFPVYFLTHSFSLYLLLALFSIFCHLRSDHIYEISMCGCAYSPILFPLSIFSRCTKNLHIRVKGRNKEL